MQPPGSIPGTPTNSNPLATLRKFVARRAPAEVCDLCGCGLATDHAHLLEPATRKLLCSCDACAILFSNREGLRYRRVPRDITSMAGLRLTDASWESLHLPINLAFFLTSTPAGRVIAVYPSPAGAAESLLPLDAWETLVRENPVLAEFEPDVEALLVNRIGPARAYYRVPIDECYKLVGLIRTHWRGLSGGQDVWEQVARFFEGLEARALPATVPQATGAMSHAEP